MKPSGPTQMPSFEQRWRQRFESFGCKGEDDAAIAGWSATGLDTRKPMHLRYESVADLKRLMQESGLAAVQWSVL